MHVPCSRSRAIWILFAVALLCAGFPGSASAERIWAEVEQPRDDDLVRAPLGLVEITGRAGTGIPGDHDVVLAIDRSPSTFFMPSGVDIDGDGRVASDFTDSTAQAFLVAARRLVARLESDSTRMGIMTFGGTERVLAELGASRAELMGALATLPEGPEPGGTFFYGAIIASIKLFERPGARGSEHRHRSLIFLSDGIPNEPPPKRFAEQAAVRASRRAAEAGVRIYAFALGTKVAQEADVFRRMVKANGGELLFVEEPRDIIEYVPHLSLTKLASIEVLNRTSGATARAARLFPDGSFDAYAPLEPGENHLRITLRGEEGAAHSIERLVRFEKTAGTSAEARKHLELLLEGLQARTRETELAQEARRKRERALRKQLEIKVER